MDRKYRAWLVIARFKTRWGVAKNVTMELFRCDEDQLREQYKHEFPKLIEGYDELDELERQLPEDVILECFTLKEIVELKSYFREFDKGTTFHYEEREFPIPSNIMPTGGMTAGGGCDFYMFNKDKNYTLSFPVWAYYDITENKFEGQTPKDFEYSVQGGALYLKEI